MNIEPLRPLLPVTHHSFEAVPIETQAVASGPELPLLLITSEHETTTRVIDLLVAGCPSLYQRHGTLVRLVLPTGVGIMDSSARIVDVTPAWLRDVISTVARFCKQVGDDVRNCLVPEWMPIIMLSRGVYPGVRHLIGVVETPVFLKDGRILTAVGYDSGSCLYLHPVTAEVKVSVAPTRQDAIRAMEELVDVVDEFPFGESPSPESQCAAALALMVTPVARLAIEGPVPFGVIEASSQASGKGLLAQVIHRIATGRPAEVLPASGDQEEFKRALLPVLREGIRVAWLDEVPNPFGGKFWNAMITAWPTYADRVIRTSGLARVQAMTCWIISGNNVQLMDHSSRRAIMVRLEPDVERPEARSGFKHDNLLDWVDTQQPRLLAAILTILRAFHLAGRPRGLPDSVGSFEAWDRLVRQCVYWVSGVDPLIATRATAEVADLRRMAWGDLAEALWEGFESTGFSAKEAVDFLLSKGSDAARMAVEELMVGKAPSPLAFGKSVLSGHRGVVARGLVLQVAKAKTKRGALYQLRQIATSK